MSPRAVVRVARGVVACLWTGLAFLVVSGGPIDSPLRSSRRMQRALIAISPQGWAFFTRDPREPVDRVFLRSGAGWVPLTYTNSSARNLFGIRRDARALNVEMAALLGDLAADDWKDCGGPLEDCLRGDDAPRPTVLNRSLTRQVCGEVAIERQPPVPWAWSRSASRLHMPSKVARLDVQCRSIR